VPGLNQIQGGRWDNLLRRFFPIKERSVAPVLAPELVGYVAVQEWEDDMFWARSEKLAYVTSGNVAVAAQRGHVQILNPAGSASLVMVEKVQVFSTAAVTFELRYLSGPIAAGIASAVSPRDQRFANVPNVGAATARVFHLNTAAVIGTSASLQLVTLAGQMDEYALGCILPPGESLLFVDMNLNTFNIVNIFWRERAAEGPELTA